MIKITLCSIIASASFLTSFAGEQVAKPASKNPVIAPTTNNNPSSTVFAYGDLREDAWYSCVGALHALNGDLYSSGIILRGFFGAGQYDYNQFNLSNPEVTGSIYDITVGAGYRQQLGNSFSITGFVSPHVRWRSLDQIDIYNQVESVQWGVQFGAELYGRTGPISWDVITQFTTVENSFWGRARAGYEFEHVNFGPELTYIENGQFNEHRFGGFIGFKPCPRSTITLNGGHAIYQFGNGADQSSLYIGFGFNYSF
jgi:hypothetical protein